jgi:hypothetical protein
MALTDWHAFEDGVRWRLTASGVEVEGSGVERSSGRPVTVTRIWSDHGDAVTTAARRYRVPVELIVATIATESAGRADAVRLEPGYSSDEATPGKVSIGLTQTLLSTARDTMRQSFGRDWLLVPGNAVVAGTSYIAEQSRLTNLDPPLVAAAYNAGRLAYQNGARNRWKLRQYPIGTGDHVDRFVRFVNDAVAVLAGTSPAPVVSLRDLLTDSPAPARSPQSVNVAPTVRWGDQARPDVVPASALGVLTDVLRAARLRDVLVTSTQRTPKEQAAVMYANCESYGVAQQKDLYGPYGDQVIDVYASGKQAGDSGTLIQAHMTEKIVDLGPQRVSRHTADPRKLAVIDVAPSSVTDRAAFERAVNAEPRVKTFLLPPKDPAYHLEIPTEG